MADAWNVLSGATYDKTIKSALDVREQLLLCDWAYMNMLQEMSAKQYGQTNEAVLMSAFLMTQSGYKIRLGKKADQLYMLVACDYTIYHINYIELDDVRFYIMGNNTDGDIELCSAGYSSEQTLSLQITTLPKFYADMSPKRKLTSRKGVTASVSSNINLLDFFGSYPRAYINNDFTNQWVAYANTPLDINTQNMLYPVLRSVVKNMPEQQAVDILLNWVQTAFVYGYDSAIWGRDRPFFAQETLFYPYSDCEDRAILFSRIVRDLLGLDVVLLYYPKHLAAAVAFNAEIEGDYMIYKNKKYIVCDPTYTNAPIGKSMPGLDYNKVVAIALK